jgi:rhodanese-related sulfurtransferase
LIPLSPENLEGFIPLASLPTDQLEAMVEHSRKLYVRKGGAIIEPGVHYTDHIYLLAGQVCFEKANETVDSGFRHPLHSKSQRNDVVYAQTDCALLLVDREQLDKILCWSEATAYIETEIDSQLNLHEEADWMKTILRSNLFHKVSPLNFEKLFDRLIDTPVRKGDVVIQQGEVGDYCYFIKKGTAEVTRTDEPGGEQIKLAEIGPGRCFGEDALIQEKVRNATITMLSDGLLVKMEKRDFIQLLKEPQVETVSPLDLQMLLDTGCRLIDVRSSEEQTINRINDSLDIPLGILRAMLWNLDNSCDYVVYCDTGRRGAAASFLLEQNGIRARALSGGLQRMPEKLLAEMVKN